MSNLKKFQSTLPKVYRPEFNRVMLALLTAIASADDDVEAAIEEAKKQLFVRTASGKDLEVLARSLGVKKPRALGLNDEDFQELIPNLSLKPKSIRKAFYDTADVFWGPEFSRANVTSGNFAPFNVSAGDVIKIQIDQRKIQEVKVLPGDIAVNGAATAEEMQKILSKIKGATITISEESLTNNQYINIRTNTPGSTGSIEFFSSSMLGLSKLDFKERAYGILDLDQRVVVYNINANELLIEIPAVIPALRRTLKGSHHFHADAAIEPPRGTAQGIWQGSFLFNPNGEGSTFTLTKQKAALQQVIQKNQVYTSIAVDDTSLFKNPFGQVIFGFGTSSQEGPVTYRGIPNSSTLLLDPGYTFKFNHTANTSIRVISQQEPYIPRRDGTDLAIYLTSPSGAREVVEEILRSLAAAGIIVRFKILAPTYKYVQDNPYITEDDEPSVED